MTFDLHRATTPSGLRLLVVPMRGTSAVTFFLAARTGARHETPDVFGISHFLEHLFFKGSKKRPTTKAISEAIDRVGGELNAFTSKEWTAFYAKAASRHLGLIVDVISDLVRNPILDEGEMDRERGVIIEEINMYEDTPLRSIGEFFEETLFGTHALAHPIIGTKEIIARLPRAAVLRYRKRQYRARSIVACLAGDVDPPKAFTLLRRALRSFPGGGAVPPAAFGRSFGHSRVRVKTKTTDQTHVVIGAPAVPFLHRDRPAVDLAATILGGGMSSRLFLEVRERRGLAYAVHTGTEHFVDAGYVATQSGVDPRKVVEAARVIVAEHGRLAATRVSASELAKAREFVKGGLLLSLETSNKVAEFFTLQEVLLNRILTPDDVFRLLDAVGPADIRRVARRYLAPRQLRLVAIGPELREAEFSQALTGPR